MLSQERQKRIYAVIKRYNSASVIDLSTQLKISLSTVRRDLSELEAHGLVQRVHGGAILVEDQREPPSLQRRDQNLEAKERIGSAAAQLVQDGDTIILSASTTVETMIPHLAQMHSLTVITNVVSVAYKLAAYPYITVIVLGGWLRHSEFSLLGQLTQEALRDLAAGKIFHSAYGLDPNYGLTGTTLQEVETDRALNSCRRPAHRRCRFKQIQPGRDNPARANRTDSHLDHRLRRSTSRSCQIRTAGCPRDCCLSFS